MKNVCVGNKVVVRIRGDDGYDETKTFHLINQNQEFVDEYICYTGVDSGGYAHYLEEKVRRRCFALANVSAGELGDQSPLGKLLIGRNVGEELNYGKRHFRILDIKK